jgi:hypothetical protein
MTAMLSSVQFARLPSPAKAERVRLEPAALDDADAPETDAASPIADSVLAGGVLAAGVMAGRAGRIVGMAVLAGALAAAIVVLAARQWLPPRPFDDPRLAQLAHEAGESAEQLATLTQKLRILETEGVAGAEATATFAAQLAGQRGELGAMKATVQRVADASANDADGQRSGATAALFGVAAVQLRDAIEQGRPFDWELVDVRGIAGHDARLLRELYRLAPMAAGGVPTATQIRQGLQALSLAEFQRGAPGIVQAGLDIVGRTFGPTLISAPANPTPALLLQAALLLERGDSAGTARALRTLTGDSAIAARPVAEAAEKRAIALDATKILLDAARGRLQSQLRSAAVVPVVAP